MSLPVSDCATSGWKYYTMRNFNLVNIPSANRARWTGFCKSQCQCQPINIKLNENALTISQSYRWNNRIRVVKKLRAQILKVWSVRAKQIMFSYAESVLVDVQALLFNQPVMYQSMPFKPSSQPNCVSWRASLHRHNVSASGLSPSWLLLRTMLEDNSLAPQRCRKWLNSCFNVGK